jgi:hypothetical protein
MKLIASRGNKKCPVARRSASSSNEHLQISSPEHNDTEKTVHQCGTRQVMRNQGGRPRGNPAVAFSLRAPISLSNAHRRDQSPARQPHISKPEVRAGERAIMR